MMGDAARHSSYKTTQNNLIQPGYASLNNIEYKQIVLVIAAVVSLLIAEYMTAFGLIILTLFNAWLGYNQEGKAESAVAALGKMIWMASRWCGLM